MKKAPIHEIPMVGDPRNIKNRSANICIPATRRWLIGISIAGTGFLTGACTSTYLSEKAATLPTIESLPLFTTTSITETTVLSDLPDQIVPQTTTTLQSETTTTVLTTTTFVPETTQIPETTIAPPITLAPETTAAPVVTETTIAETTTTIPLPTNDGVLSATECEALGGTRYSFQSGETLTGLLVEQYGLTTQQAGGIILRGMLTTDYRLNSIYADTPDDAYDLRECIPSPTALQAYL